MSETRRQLFKASVLSALGLMTASALAGCQFDGGHGFDNSEPRDPVAVGKGNGSDPYWYIFVLDTEQGKYKAYRTTVKPPPKPYDTEDWYHSLNPNSVHPVPPNSSFNIGAYWYSVDSNGYVSTPVGEVEMHMSRTRWTEISKN